MFDIGLIRVITLDDPEALSCHGRLIERAYPGLSVESACIPDQPEGIHSEELGQIAVPKIVELARTRFVDKDMILISCADDPGLAEVRAALPGKPVAGAGECTVALAMKAGKRVGVLGIVDWPPKAYREQLRDSLVGNYRPEGVSSTLDLQTDAGRAACLRAARQMAEDGCDVIALGCTGLATIGIAGELQRETGLPVIDPVVAMGAFAAYGAAHR
ncbi:aspartate/glutamate racemase family protein [Adlercreutzia aquisgranensis]|uniref:aspartate/glutamate racemase family protein n=1 Tax=Adlercreutzia aquisgranensis TaxID=2941323 RepID=UPI00203E0543|nr:aspartate/glutamate racemase family protein [Adlercreutzia aquisgranensis]